MFRNGNVGEGLTRETVEPVLDSLNNVSSDAVKRTAFAKEVEDEGILLIVHTALVG